MAQRDKKLVTVTVKDGGSNSLEIKIGAGNVTWTEHLPRRYTLDRGVLDEVVDDDQVPMDVRADFTWEYTSGGAASDGTPSVRDALRREGAASSWVSTDADSCRPYSVDLVLTYQPVCAGVASGDQEVVTLPDFRVEEMTFDLNESAVSFTGKCNALAASVARTPQS